MHFWSSQVIQNLSLVPGPLIAHHHGALSAHVGHSLIPYSPPSSHTNPQTCIQHPNSSPHLLLPSPPRSPLPSTPSLTTHDISPSTSLRTHQALPDSILFSIISYYRLDVHLAPCLLPQSPSPIPKPAPTTHPRPPHRRTMSTLAKSRLLVSHMCVANPYDLLFSRYMS